MKYSKPILIFLSFTILNLPLLGNNPILLIKGDTITYESILKEAKKDFNASQALETVFKEINNWEKQAGKLYSVTISELIINIDSNIDFKDKIDKNLYQQWKEYLNEILNEVTKAKGKVAKKGFPKYKLSIINATAGFLSKVDPILLQNKGWVEVPPKKVVQENPKSNVKKISPSPKKAQKLDLESFFNLKDLEWIAIGGAVGSILFPFLFWFLGSRKEIKKLRKEIAELKKSNSNSTDSSTGDGKPKVQNTTTVENLGTSQSAAQKKKEETKKKAPVPETKPKPVATPPSKILVYYSVPDNRQRFLRKHKKNSLNSSNTFYTIKLDKESARSGTYTLSEGNQVRKFAFNNVDANLRPGFDFDVKGVDIVKANLRNIDEGKVEQIENGNWKIIKKAKLYFK